MAESRFVGHIVDLVEPGRDRLDLAWVREATKGKMRLKTAGGREHSISEGALESAIVVDHGPAGNDGEAALARCAAAVARARDGVASEDLDLLWEAAAADEDREEAAAALAEALLGEEAPPAAVSALARCMETDRDRFARRTDRTAFVVVGRKTRERRRRRAEDDAKREEDAQRRRDDERRRDERVAGALRAFLDARDPDAWPADLDPFAAALLRSCRLDARAGEREQDAGELRHVRAVVGAVEGEAEAWSSRALAERILRIRHPGESRTRMLRRLLGLDEGFPAEVEAEAERIAANAAAFAADRLDLVHLETYTLDEPWTRDRDDALSVVESEGRVDVYVHISDVAALVPAGSAVDLAARLRGVTHYWPDGGIPMIPPSLSERCASLAADGSARPTFTARFACGTSPDGAPVLDLLGLHAAVVRVRENRSYADADEAMASRSTEWGRLLARLWEHLAALRLMRGADAMPRRREAKILVEGDGERIDVIPAAPRSPARLLIEELALATGMAAASWAREREVPLVYRIQDAPKAGARNLERASYTLTPDRHHALGGALYAHVTSPIRRYVDLLNQRQIISRLTSGRVAADEQVELQRLTLTVRSVLDAARGLAREAHRYWALRWLALRPEETFEAEVRLDPDVIERRRPPRALVLPVAVLLPLDGADPEALAAAAPPGSPASTIRVRVKVADAETLRARAVACS